MPASGRPRLRPARPEDAEEILAMVRELAEFEKEPLSSVEATAEDFRRDCFGPNARAEVLLLEENGTLLGFALYYHNFSTWLGRAGIYLEDFFLRPPARGRGLGRMVMAGLAQIAQRRGCRRLELQVLDWNPARKFYEHIGMEHRDDWCSYRIAEEGLARLASEVDDGSWSERP
ncbi:GNAT family N-acetyltransferase [Hypericibacter terrae]|nr:GNAT family N-acetyltransferase [Hypericibacter terrae]